MVLTLEYKYSYINIYGILKLREYKSINSK